jgi:hypothetical protein
MASPCNLRRSIAVKAPGRLSVSDGRSRALVARCSTDVPGDLGIVSPGVRDACRRAGRDFVVLPGTSSGTGCSDVVKSSWTVLLVSKGGDCGLHPGRRVMRDATSDVTRGLVSRRRRVRLLTRLRSNAQRFTRGQTRFDGTEFGFGLETRGVRMLARQGVRALRGVTSGIAFELRAWLTPVS